MEAVAVSAGGRAVSSVTQNTNIQLADAQQTDVQVFIIQDPEEHRPSDTTWKLGSSGFSSQCPQPPKDLSLSQGSAVSALQAKVKTLAQRRALWKQPSKNNREKKLVSMSHMLAHPSAEESESGSSDDGVKPCNGAHTLHAAWQEPQTLLSREGEFDPVTVAALLALPRGLGEGSSLENLAASNCNDKPDVSFTPSPKSQWVPPKDFWKVCRPDTLQLKEDAAAELLRTKTEVRRDLQSNISGSDLHSCMQREDSIVLAMHCGLSHAESLGSVSTRSNTISLAERVEMNRCALRQMLQKTQSKNCERNKVMDHRLEKTHVRVELHDSEADSGISVHDSEHTPSAGAAGVAPLSRRHEHAKLLLHRARMKSRCCPLRADHNISTNTYTSNTTATATALPRHHHPPELLSWVQRPAQRVPLIGKEGVVSDSRGVVSGKEGVVSGNLSDSSSSDSSGVPRRRRGQSPTRVRFEDESEKDAEVRYLERLRQRRRAGERTQGLLVPKPNLTCYISGRTELPQRARSSAVWKHHVSEGQQDSLHSNGLNESLRNETAERLCNSCGTRLDGTLINSPALTETSVSGEAGLKSVPCWLAPTLPNRLVRIEQIKETYIGKVCPAAVETADPGCRDADGTAKGTFQKQKKRTRRIDGGAVTVNGCETPDSLPTTRLAPSGTDLQSTISRIALPPNPYQPEFKAPVPPPKPCVGETRSSTPVQNVLLPLQPWRSALKPIWKDCPVSQNAATITPPSQCPPVPTEPAEESMAPDDRSPVDLQHSVVSHCQEILTSPEPEHICKNSNLKQPAVSHQHGHASECSAAPTSQPAGLEQDLIPVAGPLHGALNDGHVQGPIRAEQQRDDRSSSSHRSAAGVEQSSSTILRRFLSAVRLTGDGGRSGISRSGSVEQLSIIKSSGNNSGCSGSGRLKKAPSLQNLRLQGSPLLQLKKSSSVQSLQSPRRKPDRSNAYRAGEQSCSPAFPRSLQRALSVEDVGAPSSVRSVGRVLEVFPDGTLLLELNRPQHGHFGFLVSRGNGRPDSGVYVEQMEDNSTQKLYAGLLGVGDEIVEVNGEKVAGLSLELVTRLMTQNSTTTVRVLRHRRPRC